MNSGSPKATISLLVISLPKEQVLIPLCNSFFFFFFSSHQVEAFLLRVICTGARFSACCLYPVSLSTAVSSWCPSDLASCPSFLHIFRRPTLPALFSPNSLSKCPSSGSHSASCSSCCGLILTRPYKRGHTLPHANNDVLL